MGGKGGGGWAGRRILHSKKFKNKMNEVSPPNNKKCLGTIWLGTEMLARPKDPDYIQECTW